MTKTLTFLLVPSLAALALFAACVDSLDGSEDGEAASTDSSEAIGPCTTLVIKSVREIGDSRGDFNIASATLVNTGTKSCFSGVSYSIFNSAGQNTEVGLGSTITFEPNKEVAKFFALKRTHVASSYVCATCSDSSKCTPH